jgi:hypothetical protein
MSARNEIFAAVAALMLAGCQTNLEITQGVPKMREPLPKETKVFLIGPALENAASQFERSPAKATRAFKKALTDFGIDVTTPEKMPETRDQAFREAVEKKCDVILYVTVESWSYSDSGFSGSGIRDEVNFKVMFVKPDTRIVLERASVSLSNGLFKRRMVNMNETSAGNLLEGFTRKFFDVEKRLNEAD